MRVTDTFGAYNTRRYGRPWISKVIAWATGKRPVPMWGAYCGDPDGGIVEIDAQPGDVVRTGQRDNRGNNSTANWHIVQPDGSLQECTAVEAKEAFLQNTKTEPHSITCPECGHIFTVGS